MVAIVSAVTGGGGKGAFSPIASTMGEIFSPTARCADEGWITFGQSENPDPAVLAPSVHDFTGIPRDISKSDDCFESWKFRRQAE